MSWICHVISVSPAGGQKGLRPCCVSQVRQEAMWSDDEGPELSPKPPRSFFIDKMVLVKTLNLQDVASGSNEFTGVKIWLWEVAETASRHKCWVSYMPWDVRSRLF